MGSKRTIITLEESNKSWLEAYSASEGISMAEAIRRGIKCLKANENRKLYNDLVNKTRGKWKKGDGLDYQRQVRSEW
ncbi:MAG: hypothetical protein U5L07_11130 [Desulfobacterales bacterium]|nr:hypothetical protein [Desulfobacterales bacterium]